jgi:hypothetical protein
VPARTPAIVAVAAISAIEGLGLLGYAIYDIVQTLRLGVTGPEEVSNVPAVVLIIVILLLFGAGMLCVARGWWREERWARAPFLVAQILGVLVGWDLAQASGGSERIIGIAVIIVAAIGIVLAFLPAVARAIEPPD